MAITSNGSDESTVATGSDSEPEVTTPTTEAPAVVDTTLAVPPTIATSSPTLAPTVAPTREPAAVPTAPHTPTQVAEDPSARWKLYFDDATKCAEVVAGAQTFSKLLCGAEPASATEVIGDAVTFDTPRGRMLVATSDARVTGFSSFPRASGSFEHDAAVGVPASVPGLRFVAGVIVPQWTDILVRGGVHHLARIVIPPDNRQFGHNELERVLAPPYGAWNGYRRLTSTGYYLGGDQELGFYTHADGRACVLYRRFAGAFENVIRDGCMNADAGHLQLATLENVSGPYMPRAFIVLAVSDIAGQLSVVLPDGTVVAQNVGSYRDEGSDWIAHAQNISHVTVPEGVTTVDFVITADGKELARETVTVPGR